MGRVSVFAVVLCLCTGCGAYPCGVDRWQPTECAYCTFMSARWGTLCKDGTCTYFVDYGNGEDKCADPCHTSPGQYCNRLVPTDCPMNAYCALSDMDSPTYCNPGTYSSVTKATSASVCAFTCAAGSYCANGVHNTCPAGTWSAAGSSVCTECVAGQYSNAIGATSGSTCLQCPAGSYCVGGIITSCASGDIYCPTAGLSASTPCNLCTPGQYMITACTAFANSACAACPPYTFSLVNWAPSCASIGTCAPGTYFVSSSQGCVLCTTGFYCPDVQSKIACDAGYACPAGSTMPVVCTGNTYCVAGTSAAVPCTTCSAGTYETESCSVFQNAVCSACPVGTYCNTVGMTAPLPCPAGSYCSGTRNTNPTTCPAGSYCSGTENPSSTPCPAGSYCSGTGNTYPTAICSVAGTYCPASASAPVDCTAGYFCSMDTTTQTRCASGYVSPAAATECTICPAGTFSSVSVCATCPPNSQSAAGVSTSSITDYNLVCEQYSPSSPHRNIWGVTPAVCVYWFNSYYNGFMGMRHPIAWVPSGSGDYGFGAYLDMNLTTPTFVDSVVTVGVANNRNYVSVITVLVRNQTSQSWSTALYKVNRGLVGPTYNSLLQTTTYIRIVVESVYSWPGDKPALGAGVRIPTSGCACNDGYYKPSALGALDFRECVQCAPGFFSAKGSTSCFQCAANTFVDPVRGCTNCSLMSQLSCSTGTYPASCTVARNSACLDCAPVANMLSWNGTWCNFTCVPSMYRNGSTCSRCPAGAYFCNGSMVIGNCTRQCPGNAYLTKVCSNATDMQCTQCTPECSPGTYETVSCTNMTNRVCLPCPNASYCLGNRSVANCTKPCSIRQYEASSCTPATNRACASCPAGHFCLDNVSAIACNVTNCPAGMVRLYGGMGGFACYRGGV
jgi:hypothetical protein